MPSAIPFQQGLIGLYNNETSPGVYVSWDADTSFNSTFSVIFKGAQNANYRFPLIISNYISSGITSNLGTPVAVGAGNTYIYCLTTANLIAFRKTGDTFTKVGIISNGAIESGKNPTTLKVGTIGTTEILLAGYPQGFCDSLTFSGSNFTKSTGVAFSSISGVSTTLYATYDLAISGGSILFSYGNFVYGGNIALDSSNNIVLSAGSTGIILSVNNGITSEINKIAGYCGKKIAVTDSSNSILEFLYDGNIGLGNTYSQWTLNFTLTQSDDQVWSGLIYNHFGILVATDSYNDTVNVIAATSHREGRIINSIGSQGINYLQFDSPNCLAEDSEFNIIIGDLNNRLTYLPTALDYIATLNAPLTEYIDSSGNPADTYFIKQAVCDYSSIKSLPPFTGDELLLKSSVLYELNALLRVAIYDEEPLFGYNRTSATLAYGDIVTDPVPQVRITVSTNQGQRSSMFVLSPYTGMYNTLDQSTSDTFDAPVLNNNYSNGLFYRFTNEGKLYFYDSNGDSVSIQEYDTILVSYYVKLFTNRQINNALYLALQSINAQPGLNKISSVGGAPFWYDATLVAGAAYYLIRQLLVGLNQRERRLLVMDPDSGAFDAVANLKDIAKMYQEEFTELLKKLPLAKRPLLGTITVPEFQVPGSRSRLFRGLWKGQAS
jgi:hypothetical protein